MHTIALSKRSHGQDTVFETERPVSDFRFDAKVAKVFDDMVSRSVPFYDEMQRMTAQLARDFAVPGTNLYDIGCSTATTLLALDQVLPQDIRFIGIDNAPEMLAQARKKVLEAGANRVIQFKKSDMHGPIAMKNASVITLLLTLQFVRPLHRERVMQSIFRGLNENGALILIEKVTSEDTDFNRLFIEHYYDFKRRNGYSETEIAKKRQALENVLIPYRMEENFELLRHAGFRRIEVFFRWFNFCGIVAVK